MDITIEKKLHGFKQIAQEKLQSILCSIPNPKDFIIEPALIKPLEHVCIASWVKSKGVQRIFKFDAKNPPPKQKNTHVYFISANLVVFKHVLDQIHAHEDGQDVAKAPADIKDYHIIVLPNVYTSFHVLLEEEGLYGIVALHKFNWDFIYLDESLLTLELPQVFSEVFINKDNSILSSIAHSLRLFNMILGQPDLVLTFGQRSEVLWQMMTRLDIENSRRKPSDFSAMIIIDRDKDYPSCLLTPAIYSGLLLEVFKLRTGELEIQSASNKISSEKLETFRLGNSPSEISEKKEVTTKIRMNGAYDEIYSENRYKHFSEASNLVRTQAKRVGVEVQNLDKMKINEMHTYVAKKLPKLTELKGKISKHLIACEEIIKELAGNFQQQQSLEEDILNNLCRKQILAKIDEILTLDAHKYNALRLVCLVHLSISLSIEELSNFIRNYCNVFGHKYLPVFQALAKANLLPTFGKIGGAKTTFLPNLQLALMQQTEFQANANRLKLLSGTVDVTKPSQELSKVCPSYVFNGTYIPLAAQLSSHLLNSNSFEDFSNKIGVVEKIKIFHNAYKESTLIKTIALAVKKGELIDVLPLKKRMIFIFICGGVTYAEIAACNFVARMSGSKIVVASNCILSGSDLTAAAF